MKFDDDLPRSPHPFRDSLIIYGCLAVLIVVIGGFTGGGFAKAAAVAAAFFVAASVWSWWRIRKRPQQERGG